jgi:hypothetical protein
MVAAWSRANRAHWRWEDNKARQFADEGVQKVMADDGSGPRLDRQEGPDGGRVGRSRKGCSLGWRRCWVGLGTFRRGTVGLRFLIGIRLVGIGLCCRIHV